MDSWGPWLLFLACAFGAEVLGTMAGFGAATILTPIAILFMDVKTAIALVACFHLFGNASRLSFFWRHVHGKTWVQFGLTGILCSFAGAGLTAHLSSSAVKWLFGVFLLIYVGLSTLLPSGLRFPATAGTLIGGGVASGFVAGLIGTGGAIRSACLLAFGLPRDVYLGTSAAIALVVDATRLPVYLFERFIPWRMLPVVASLVLVAFAGAWTGQRLVRRVSPVVFRRLILAMLTLMAIKLCAEGWHGVLSGRPV